MGLIVFGGIAFSYLEKLEVGHGIYFAFITGLTIGYGDIVPETLWGRVVSIIIGMIGMIFIGVSVAIATQALAATVKDIEQINHQPTSWK